MRQSLGYALAGILHAFERERNLRLFLAGYVLVVACGIAVRLLAWEWLALVLSGGLFFTAELLNTAMERLSDVLDHERKLLGRHAYHVGIRAGKDVAAAASLVSLITTIIVVLIVFWPYAGIYLF